MAEPTHTFVPFQFDIDFELFDWWTEGVDQEDAVSRRMAIESSLVSGLEISSALFEEGITGEVADYFEVFSLIEPHLHQPLAFLRSSPLFGSLSEAFKLLLLERYYAFDAAVVREFLGRKPLSRDRKELDEISEKTNVPLRSVKRQYENLRRAWKLLDESSSAGSNSSITGTPLTSSTPIGGRSSSSDHFSQSTVSLIGTAFCIPVQLAWQYTSIMFLCRHRFDVCRRRLQSLSGQSFLNFARNLIDQWSYFSYNTPAVLMTGGSSHDSATADRRSADDFDIDFDHDFTHDLRELRSLQEKDNLESALRAWNPRSSTKSMPHNHYHYDWLKETVRELVGIAVKLHRSKDARGFFLDLMEDVVDPSIESNWSLKEFETLLTELRQIDLKFQNSLNGLWQRFIQGVSPILLEMMRSKVSNIPRSGSQSANHSTLTSTSPNFLVSFTQLGLSASYVIPDQN